MSTPDKTEGPARVRGFLFLVESRNRNATVLSPLMLTKSGLSGPFFNLHDWRMVRMDSLSGSTENRGYLSRWVSSVFVYR